MSFYVVGGYDPSPHKCADLTEAYGLADTLSLANDNFLITNSKGVTFRGHSCPVEIFTEDEWKNAVRCD